MACNMVVEFAKMDKDDMRNYLGNYFHSIVQKHHADKVNPAYEAILKHCSSNNDFSLEFIRTSIELPLIVALGDLDLAKYMISNGVDVNVPFQFGNFRALNMACCQEDLKMTELLLQNNAEVNALDGDNDTPLMSLFDKLDYSSDLDNTYRMTRLLVSYGAKIPPHNIRVMFQAVQYANLDTVRLLVDEANGNLNFSFEGNTCLHVAVHNNEPDVLEYVIEVFRRDNMDIDSRNDFGDTPLLMASDTENVANFNRVIKTLLKSGADVNVKNIVGQTSLDLVMLGGGKRDPELAWLYFDLGIDILNPEVTTLYQAVKLETPWMKDIVAEIAKKVTMGATIAGKNQKALNLCDKARRYLRLCKKQLVEMRKIKFYENVSFWDVLTADQTKMMEYTQNFELVNAFFDSKCKRTFSIYCARMRIKFINIMSRNSLIDLSTGVTCKTIKRPELYEIFQHEVMTYMKKDDFLKLLGCCN